MLFPYNGFKHATIPDLPWAKNTLSMKSLPRCPFLPARKQHHKTQYTKGLLYPFLNAVTFANVYLTHTINQNCFTIKKLSAIIFTKFF